MKSWWKMKRCLVCLSIIRRSPRSIWSLKEWMEFTSMLRKILYLEQQHIEVWSQTKGEKSIIPLRNLGKTANSTFEFVGLLKSRSGSDVAFWNVFSLDVDLKQKREQNTTIPLRWSISTANSTFEFVEEVKQWGASDVEILDPLSLEVDLKQKQEQNTHHPALMIDLHCKFDIRMRRG